MAESTTGNTSLVKIDEPNPPIGWIDKMYIRVFLVQLGYTRVLVLPTSSSEKQ